MRGQGLLSFENDCVVRERIDVVFPVLHGENGEDGSMQGLLQIAGIAYVGSGVGASSACMDKSMTKLIAQNAGILQARWQVIRAHEWERDQNGCMDAASVRFPIRFSSSLPGPARRSAFPKRKAGRSWSFPWADALRYGEKVLIEEFIDGQEIEVAVLGNENPCASVCGEIEAGAEFYDYEAKYLSDSARFYVPARISEELSEQVRETAVKVYTAMECRGLARVDFFVRREDGAVVFNEINTIPGFTSISMYPKLFGGKRHCVSGAA